MDITPQLSSFIIPIESHSLPGQSKITYISVRFVQETIKPDVSALSTASQPRLKADPELIANI